MTPAATENCGGMPSRRYGKQPEYVHVHMVTSLFWCRSVLLCAGLYNIDLSCYLYGQLQVVLVRRLSTVTPSC